MKSNKDGKGKGFSLDNPVVVIDNGVERTRYFVNLKALNPADPLESVLGILLSDLLSTLALAAHAAHGSTAESWWRRSILRAMKEEEELKVKDPDRGKPKAEQMPKSKARLH